MEKILRVGDAGLCQLRILDHCGDDNPASPCEASAEPQHSIRSLILSVVLTDVFSKLFGVTVVTFYTDSGN